jgi:hypothetical protein
VVEQAGSSASVQATNARLGVNSRAAPVPHAGSTSSRDDEECLHIARRGPPKLLGRPTASGAEVDDRSS